MLFVEFNLNSGRYILKIVGNISIIIYCSTVSCYNHRINSCIKYDLGYKYGHQQIQHV